MERDDNPYQAPVVSSAEDSTRAGLRPWQKCAAISFGYSISAMLAYFAMMGIGGAVKPPLHPAISAVILFLYAYSMPFTFPLILVSLKMRGMPIALMYFLAFAACFLISFCVAALFVMRAGRRGAS